MIRRLFSLFTALMLLMNINIPALTGNRANKNEKSDSPVQPDTWAAVDGLGRVAPLNVKKCGDHERFVGMFYWTWHYNFARDNTAKNVTEMLKGNESALHDYNADLWNNAPDGAPHFWDEPVYGYYSDLDEYVIRKQAELIADAGVDFIVTDCTNGTATWDEANEVLFKVLEQAKADGVNVPQVAFMLPFWDGESTHISLKNLYEKIYSSGRYEDLWFKWDGKPLIMAHPDCLDENNPEDKAILDCFTFRLNEASYFADSTFITENIWGWCSDYPQAKYGCSLNGSVEEMCVSIAQNAHDGNLAAMNCVEGAQGRSFTKGLYSYKYFNGKKNVRVDKNTENALYYGLNFQQQWDRALLCDPDVVFVTGWNEWIAGRWSEWCGTENAFPDEFSPEYSRDIEPSNGELKDYYYYQLVTNIRRYKGTEKPVAANESGEKEYYHYTNNTPARDCDGWVGLHYTADTMRNDFKKVTVKNDSENVYFTVECENNITPYTDRAWMRILIDSSPNPGSDNWEGFEYIINRDNASPDTVTVEKSTGGWAFIQTGNAEYTVNGNIMTVAVPLCALSMDAENVHFNFKLSDNMLSDGDIMDFYKNGDVAPGGRFAFVY
ncbi:MAG: hypothetical protein MJ177_01495 [Clostridia bacterium]|nr:hypothetical protein [Clostridia bacterium]